MGIFLSFLNMFNSVFWAGGGGGGFSQIKYLSKSIRTEALGLSELLQKAKRKQQEKKIEHLLSLKSSFQTLIIEQGKLQKEHRAFPSYAISKFTPPVTSLRFSPKLIIMTAHYAAGTSWVRGLCSLPWWLQHLAKFFISLHVCRPYIKSTGSGKQHISLSGQSSQ